jgi:hypothetical protein
MDISLQREEAMCLSNPLNLFADGKRVNRCVAGV